MAAQKMAKAMKNKRAVPASAKKGRAAKLVARKAEPKKPELQKKKENTALAKKKAAAGGAKKKVGEVPKHDRLVELRKVLKEKREAIVREAKEEIAKYISGETRQLVDTALDEGDFAVVDISEDVNLMRLAAHRKMLLDIDEALRKIGEGTYGICEECGEEISEKRLKVLPTATLCISCQENKERLEAIQKEEI
jgi:DnaK suppressor protein